MCGARLVGCVSLCVQTFAYYATNGLVNPGYQVLNRTQFFDFCADAKLLDGQSQLDKTFAGDVFEQVLRMRMERDDVQEDKDGTQQVAGRVDTCSEHRCTKTCHSKRGGGVAEWGGGVCHTHEMAQLISHELWVG